MKYSFFLGALLLVSCRHDEIQSSVQAAPAGQPGYSADCVTPGTDPFSLPVRMTKKVNGIHPCLDIRRRRPVVDLMLHPSLGAGWEPKEALPPLDEDRHYRIANLFHQGQFWFADIPVGNIKAMTFQVEKFKAAVPAAHTQIRVSFHESDPVLLYPIAGTQPATAENLTEIVLTAEAVGAPGDSFNLLAGQVGAFAIVFSVRSMRDRLWEIFFGNELHDVAQYPLNFTRKDPQQHRPEHLKLMRSYLEAFIKRSDLNRRHLLEEAEKSVYRTTGYNCTTELIKIIENDLNISWKTADSMAAAVLAQVDFYPPLSPKSLSKLGIIEKGPDGKEKTLPKAFEDDSLSDLVNEVKSSPDH